RRHAGGALGSAVTGRFTAPAESELDVARAARAMPLAAGDPPTITDLLLDGDTALFLDGPATAVPLLRRAVAALQADDSDSPDVLQRLGSDAGLPGRSVTMRLSTSWLPAWNAAPTTKARWSP